MPTREWALTVQFEGTFHVGSGYGHSGRIDRTLLRDAGGLPFVPGSAIKGKLRHAARAVAPVLDKRLWVCEAACLPGADACSVCLLFGSPFREGKLSFSDACCQREDNPGIDGLLVCAARPPMIWGERQNVAIDRRQRTSRHGQLMQSECAPDGLLLRATISGDLTAEELTLLRGAVKSLLYFGSGSARGMGRCRCSLH
jgi:CRISPR/Cas system CSM-associated protein Csm3 (group 7 of RAMP superfamily)